MARRGETQPIEHSTYSGYQAHNRHGPPIDDEDSCGCRAAGAAYMRAYRKDRPQILASQEKRRHAARERALRVLARRHQAEFLDLLAFELRRK